jgi:F0F1-type ATP synthase membrane subunit c/vacuolar-type H+-ATPase subunit K
MLEAQEKEAITKGMQTLWFIWAAMLGSLLIYIFVCHQWGEGFGSAEGTGIPLELLRTILYGVAVVELIISYYLRKFMLKGRSSAAGAHIVGGLATMNQPPFVGHYSAVVIVSLALSESIGIYGFVLFLLGDGFQTLYTFMVVSALAMVFYRPKREELERLAVAYKKRDESVPEM